MKWMKVLRTPYGEQGASKKCLGARAMTTRPSDKRTLIVSVRESGQTDQANGNFNNRARRGRVNEWFSYTLSELGNHAASAGNKRTKPTSKHDSKTPDCLGTRKGRGQARPNRSWRQRRVWTLSEWRADISSRRAARRQKLVKTTVHHAVAVGREHDSFTPTDCHAGLDFSIIGKDPVLALEGRAGRKKTGDKKRLTFHGRFHDIHCGSQKKTRQAIPHHA